MRFGSGVLHEEAVTSMIGKRVTSSMRWLVLAQMLGQGGAVLASLVVIRILEPTDYGLMAMAAVVLGLILLLNEMGLGSALIQQASLSRVELERVFGLLLVVNLGLALALIGAAPAIAVFFDEPRVTPLIQVMALRLPLMALLVVPRSMLRRDMLFRRKAMVDLAGILSGSAATLVLALMGYGVWSIVVGILIGGVVEVIGTYIASPVRVWPAFSIRGMGQQCRFGGFVTLDRILWYSYSQADVVVLGRFLGPELLGVYSVAKRLASMPLDRLGGIVNEVGFSAYSSAHRDGLSVPEYYCKAARLASFFTFPLFFGMAAIAPEAIPVVLGEKWSPAVLPFQLLALVMPLRQLNVINTPALMGIGRPDVNVVNLLIALVIMVPAFLIGVQWGVIGVCLAWVIAYPVYFAIMLWRSLAVLQVSARSYLGAILPSALTAAVMVGCVEVSRRLLDDWLIQPVLLLAALAVVGFIGYFAAAGLLNRPQCREILSVLRR